MPNVLVSLNDNTLKASLMDKKLGLATTSSKVDAATAKGTRIVDTQKLSQSLAGLLKEFPNLKPKSTTLTFLVEPEDAYFTFVTVNKRDGDVQEQIVNEVREKLQKVDFDQLYFSYQKIAPFVYQFVAIKKEFVEKYIEVSNILAYPLHAVVPWIGLLPKYIKTTEPCVFISKEAGRNVVVLCDLNAVYYSEVYTKEKTPEELEALVHDLSIYKKNTSVNKIYTLDSEAFSLDPSYEIVSVKFEGFEDPAIAPFKTHLLFYKVISEVLDILESHLNLLTLLPLPVVEKKSRALVYVGSVVMLVVFLAGVFGLITWSNGTKTNESKSNNTQTAVSAPVVLSETDTKTTSPKVEAPKVELKKFDINLRVENGAGIPGIAAKAQAYLQGLGYNVPTIGNSEGANRTNTLVKIKTSKIAYKDMLITDLKKDYQLVVEDGLKEDSAFDVLIVVGSN